MLIYATRLIIWFPVTLFVCFIAGTYVGGTAPLGWWSRGLISIPYVNDTMIFMWFITGTVYALSSKWHKVIQRVLFSLMWIGSFLYFYSAAVKTITT